MISSEQIQNAALLWQEHRDAEFPAGLRGVEFEGIDLVLLDADTAGCVDTWIGNGGALDPRRRRVLETCVEDLDRALPQIRDPSGHRYYQRLHQLALLVSGALDAESASLPDPS
ncbi:hypothetical protein SAM40697_3165 [Streptomyces ambofaciens]|uniref:Uncharacterized protein n=1 Tax=Streptomyces ambofaciens TaxID=1889 RepID=A0ABN4PAM6_STRAM|nr:hypothetical protein [Streptomyces ambofaciens]ANB07123.1 hypothetical protein SAM40697_3165 [Streptomyces ambofaciens]